VLKVLRKTDHKTFRKSTKTIWPYFVLSYALVGFNFVFKTKIFYICLLFCTRWKHFFFANWQKESILKRRWWCDERLPWLLGSSFTNKCNKLIKYLITNDRLERVMSSQKINNSWGGKGILKLVKTTWTHKK